MSLSRSPMCTQRPGSESNSVDCLRFSSQRMLSFFSIGTRVGLTRRFSAFAPWNLSRFQNLIAARRKISAWKTEYNSRRPHSSLGYLTPDEFVRQWRFVSPSYDPCRAAEQPRQGDPDGLRFAPALTRLPRCPEISIQERETKKEIGL